MLYCVFICMGSFVIIFVTWDISDNVTRTGLMEAYARSEMTKKPKTLRY